MKKYLLKITTLLLFSVAVTYAAQAQFVIKVRPAAPVMRARPASPRPQAYLG
jgi:hypothetical protein